METRETFLMKNKEIAKIFNKMADILEFKGDLSFRINSYRKAARVLEEMTEDIAVYDEEGRLQEIAGIGEGLSKKIDEYLKTGKISKYEEIRKGVSTELMELLEIPGLGPKTVAQLHMDLGINNVDALEKAVKEGRLKGLFGMGKKKEENIARGIDLFRAARSRMSIGVALPVVDRIIAGMKKIKGIKKIEPAGSLRRMQETIGDIDILVCGADGKGIIEKFTKMPFVKNVLACGETKGSVIVDEGLQVDVRVVDEDCYGAALQYFTGSKGHNVRLREFAKERGYKVSEYGIFKGDRKIGGREESEIYKKLGLDFIPPVIRLDRGEIEAARTGKLPKLVQLKDIRGDMHVHSNWSDGASSIEELAQEALKYGYEYIAVCDHSQSLKVGRGLSIDSVFKKLEEIEKVRARFKDIKLLFGTEVDIKSDGAIDYPDEILEKFDYVAASIHSGFKESEEQITSRILNAIENPNVDAIAHPTGRLISSRDPYSVDLEKVFKAAARRGTLLEINSYYDRLDLNDIAVRRGKELGVKFVLGTDSHHKEQFWMMRLGVGVARRGWLEKEDIANSWTYSKMTRYFAKRK